MELTALENDRLRFATHSVSRALALSLALHLLLFGTLELSRYLKLQLPEWLKSVLDLSRQVNVEKKAVSADQEQPTLTFVEVNPSQAMPEPPKETKNYSAFNSLAANPDVSIDSEKPKIDGTQDKVPKVEDALRPTPPQPLTPLKPEPQPPKTETESKPDQPPGQGDCGVSPAFGRIRHRREDFGNQRGGDAVAVLSAGDRKARALRALARRNAERAWSQQSTAQVHVLLRILNGPRHPSEYPG